MHLFRKIYLKLIKVFIINSKIEEIYRLICNLVKNSEKKERKKRVPNNLNENSFTVYSQSDEDGIIDQIFEKILYKNKFFIEIGVEDGLECNTTFLLSQGWTGVWLEGDQKFEKSITNNFQSCINKDQLKVVFGYLDKNNINTKIIENSKNLNPDLLSIDIGLSTFKVLEAINIIKPRLIIVEYNPIFGPSKNIVVQENNHESENWWNNEFMFGASLKAYEVLLKDYRLVACSSSGANAFFVHHDEDLSKFNKPFNSENYFEEEKYYLIDSFKSWHKKRLFKKTTKIK